MKNVLAALLFLTGLSAHAAPVGAPGSSPAPSVAPAPATPSLAPSYVNTRGDGSKDSEFDYRSAVPLYSDLQVQTNSQGAVLRASGWISFEGQAAQAFFEQMTQPVSWASGAAHGMIPETELRVGKDYFCERSIIMGQPKYECSINMSDVRSGTITNTTELGMVPASKN